jgi:hypothetical protein
LNAPQLVKPLKKYSFLLSGTGLAYSKLSFSVTVRSRGGAVKPFKTSPSFIGFRSLRSEFSLLSRTALVIILAALCLLILTGNAYPGQVTLLWDPVTHPDLAG